MGWFLPCFGCSRKRKRRKPSNKILSADQGHVRYEPLGSDVTIKLDIRENSISSFSDSKGKGKEVPSYKVKKKVSFNLNVKTYEPIPSDEVSTGIMERDEEPKLEENEEAILPYTSNYRYQNWKDGYFEEDDIKFEESDPDDDEDENEDEDHNGEEEDDDRKINQAYSSSVESNDIVTYGQLAEDGTKNCIPFRASQIQELTKLESNYTARDRSRFMYPVLNPVENLTQWKAVKATATPPLKQQKKENMALDQEQQILFTSKNPLSFYSKAKLNHSKPQMQDIAVDASLSNWLVSSNMETTTKGSITAVTTRP